MTLKSILRPGFTLVELLIVIAIVGILATMLTTNLQSARARARDSRRKQDFLTIQQALRLYYNDHAAFPLTANLSWGSALQSADGNNTYLSVLPYDPSSTSTSPISYQYYSTGPTYILGINLENKSDPDIAESQARCPTTYPLYTATYTTDNTEEYVVCEE